MKTNLLLLVFSLISLSAFSQAENKRMQKEDRIETLRIGYLTDDLDLTVEESQSFWPIFNAHEKRRKEISAQREKLDRNTQIDDATASRMIENELRIEQELLDHKKEFIADLAKVIPSTKIAKLIRASKRFRKELLDNMKDRRKGMEKRRRRG